MKLTKKQKEIIKEVHDHVRKECIGFAEDDVFKNHVLGVRDFAVRLAKEYNADLFSVIIASYMHDLYFIKTRDHSVHEIQGSEYARHFLEKYNLPSQETDKIANCILNHRGSKNNLRNSIEEKIVACADAMDHIDRFLPMFYRISKRMSYKEAVEWITGKIERSWKKVSLKKAREMIRPKYMAAKIVFEGSDKYF